MNKKTKIAIGALVILLVVTLLVYNLIYASGNTNFVAFDNKPISIATYVQLKAVATNTTLASLVGQGVAGMNPYALPKPINGTPIIQQGKPTIIFIGAEYCPYCAVARWSLMLAMMRFGDFTQLHYMTSSSRPGEVYPITPTFTFYNSTYNSSFISFDPTEIETNTEQPLQTPDKVSNSSFITYDLTGGVPFFDFGNRSTVTGPSVSPGVINNPSHPNWDQIIAQLSQSNTTVSQAIIGAANIYTAQICNMDNMNPSSVCSQPYIATILRKQGQ